MDDAALASEIAADPLGLGYAGQPEWRVAELLNAPRVAAKVKVPTHAGRAQALGLGRVSDEDVGRALAAAPAATGG